MQHEIQRTNGQPPIIDGERTYKLAQCIANCRDLRPQSFDTAEKIMVAFQYGWEIGLSPMQSLQSIAVINGRPALYGDALPALINGSGKCEYVKERFEGEGDDYAAVVEAKRKDQSEPVIRRFSIRDAKAAGLWGKGGPWKQYPDRMLQMRARSFAFRDAFADVLRGFGTVEEQQDILTHKGQDRESFQPQQANGATVEPDDPLVGQSEPVEPDVESEGFPNTANTPEEVAQAVGVEQETGEAIDEDTKERLAHLIHEVAVHVNRDVSEFYQRIERSYGATEFKQLTLAQANEMIEALQAKLPAEEATS